MNMNRDVNKTYMAIMAVAALTLLPCPARAQDTSRNYVKLKNIAQVEHSKHRCFENFVVNMLGALAAYCCFPKKTCINVQRTLDTQLSLF